MGERNDYTRRVVTRRAQAAHRQVGSGLGEGNVPDSMKVLLIQQVAAQTALEECLRARGPELVVETGLEAGKERAGAEVFPVIIVELDSLVQAQEFCRWFKKRASARESFVVVALPNGGTQLTERDLGLLLDAGANDLIPRGCDLAQIAVRLAAIGRQSSQAQQSLRREQRLMTRAQQQVAIAAMGQAALTEDLETLTDLVSRFVVHTLDVEFCCLLEVAADKQSLRFNAGFGWCDGWIGRILAVPAAQTVNGRTLAGEDLMLEDLRSVASGEPADYMIEHGILSGISVGVKGRQGKPFGILGAYSGRKRLFVEDDLRFIEGLANVVGAAIERRRADLEIEQQQKQVQHLQRLESVGQMAASLAHDYNNVLTVVHGHVTIALADPSLGPKTASSLKRALEAVEKAAALTRQLLSFSRKESIVPELVDLNVVVQAMVRLLDRVLGKSIAVETNLGGALPGVLADKGMLDQVLLNLATNARDAMPQGGVLRIETCLVTVNEAHPRPQPDARPGEFVRLSVVDTGCGMDQATLRQVFQPFFTTKPPGKGTGLGLSTVFGIVKQHQGWIEVQSSPGQGTGFHLFLPSSGQPAPRPLEPAGPVDGKKESGTILLVEDEPTVRELARMLLEDLGFRVVEAGSGSEARSIWEQEADSIQLVLTDFVMADGVTGYELAAQLQKERPGLKVVFTSGYSPERVRQALPKGQAFHFLQKPYRTETLARTLKQCLESS